MRSKIAFHALTRPTLAYHAAITENGCPRDGCIAPRVLDFAAVMTTICKAKPQLRMRDFDQDTPLLVTQKHI